MTLHEVEQKSLQAEAPVVEAIFKAEGSKVIAIGMKRGVVLHKHTAPSKAKLLVIKGEVDFNTENQSKRLALYDTYDIPLEVTHSVEAYEDALFLLLLES
jgi:quercetin dioxygenase-like cupin family protein